MRPEEGKTLRYVKLDQATGFIYSHSRFASLRGQLRGKKPEAVLRVKRTPQLESQVEIAGSESSQQRMNERKIARRNSDDNSNRERQSTVCSKTSSIFDEDWNLPQEQNWNSSSRKPRLLTTRKQREKIPCRSVRSLFIITAARRLRHRRRRMTSISWSEW